jgi:hypothetical protein
MLPDPVRSWQSCLGGKRKVCLVLVGNGVPQAQAKVRGVVDLARENGGKAKNNRRAVAVDYGHKWSTNKGLPLNVSTKCLKLVVPVKYALFCHI